MGGRIKRIFAIVLGAGAVLSAYASSALADHGTLRDPRGDVKFDPRGRPADRDITRAVWRHASRDRLVHKVSVRGNIGDPRTGVGQLPELQIGAAGQKGPLSAKRSGGVSVKKVSRHTVKYVLSEEAIGNPSAYRWRFFFPARTCRKCAYDRAPNHGSKLHSLDGTPPPPPPPPPPPNISPIRHVVIVYQENHSFDNVLGRLCARTGRCQGATRGTLPDGSRIPLATSPDIVPRVGHQTSAQNAAINGGLMNGFAHVHGCEAKHDHRCYTQFRQRQIPNLWKLAKSYAMSDQTFQMDSVPSFGAHVELVSATLNGFTGDPPPDSPGRAASGWGCDSHLDAPWRATPDSEITYEPSCVPWYGLDPDKYPYGGAYRPTNVQPTDTILDRLDGADLGWKLYTAEPGNGYLWSICPNYAKCIYTGRKQNQVDTRDVIDDAKAGSLPNFSVVLPTLAISQHNGDSMKAGDNWIGRVVNAIQNGPRLALDGDLHHLRRLRLLLRPRAAAGRAGDQDAHGRRQPLGAPRARGFDPGLHGLAPGLHRAQLRPVAPE